MNTPASEDFQMVLKLVGSAVLNRKAAAQYGGKTGQTLQRLAWERSNKANELMRGLVVASPAQQP